MHEFLVWLVQSEINSALNKQEEKFWFFLILVLVHTSFSLHSVKQFGRTLVNQYCLYKEIKKKYMEFGEFLLSYDAEYFVFQFVIQKYGD
jgi:hypothetical protein